MNEKPQPHEKKSGRAGNVLKFAAVLLGAYLVSNFVTSFFGSDDGTSSSAGANPAVIVPAMIASALIVLCLHEVGHLIGGKLGGSRFAIFVVGPLRLQATANGIEPFFNRSITMAGGLAGTAPTGTHSLRRKMAVMTAGGPVMSFVVAGAAYALSTVVRSGFFGPLLIAVALMSAVIGAVTLVPISNGGFFTDGSRLLMLFRGGAESKRWCAISAIAGASMLGERPREWDSSLIETALAPADGSLDDVSASLSAAHSALDLGDTEKAKKLLQRATSAENVPGIFRTQALLENAFFQAFFEGDVTGARSSLSEAESGSVLEKHLLLRAEAAVLLAEGSSKEASEKARLALDDLAKSMSPGTARMEMEWLQQIEDGHSFALLSETRKK